MQGTAERGSKYQNYLKMITHDALTKEERKRKSA
jgi:hypothetical protein